MKNALLISPYFLPSNLAGVHRVRLMSGHLQSFGWEPTIITVDPSYYEEPSDSALMHLMPHAVRVERVGAWPNDLCRRVGFGDISLRAQWAMRRRVAELVERLRPTLIFATVLPGYTSLVGAWANRRFNLPFVLDYQDPWVPLEGTTSWNKAGLANRIAQRLEPRVLRHVDAVTAVSDATLASLRTRDLLPRDGPVEIIPIGADQCDHVVAAEFGRSLIRREEGTTHLAYLGTLTARMLPALEVVLTAVAKAQVPSQKRFAVHLIGTSAQANGEDQHELQSLATRAGLTKGCLHLHPARVSYLDALRTMQDADLLLLVGSTDAHYTASKLFPYWLSGKAVFGLFHRASTVIALAEELGGIRLALYDEDDRAETRIDETAAWLSQVVAGLCIVPARHEDAFLPYSAEGIASRYARLFDTVAARCA